MAVVSANLRSQESGVSQGETTATLVYIVVVDDPPNDNSETARLACPGVGSLFANSSARCIASRAVMVDNDPSVFQVTADYSSKFDASQAGDPNPLNRAAAFAYNGNNIGQPYFRDQSPQPDGFTGYGPDGTGEPVDGETPAPWTGKPVVNSAGELFANLPERQISQGTITITRNETGYSDSEAETWKNTVNSDDVTLNGVTYTAGQLLMGNISATGPQIESYTDGFGTPVTVTYWSVSYTISKKAEKWIDNFEDRGLSELTGEDGDDDRKLQPILDRTGVPVTFPYPLDGSGSARAKPTDIPSVLKFLPYKPREWANHRFV